MDFQKISYEDSTFNGGFNYFMAISLITDIAFYERYSLSPEEMILNIVCSKRKEFHKF